MDRWEPLWPASAWKAPGEAVGLLIAAAAPRELSFVFDPGEAPPLPAARVAAWEGVPVVWLLTGPGPVNAALALGAALSRWTPRLLLNVGVAGAYPAGGLSPGSLAVATVEFDADTGVEPLDGEAAPAPLSIPVVQGLPHGRYPVDAQASERLLAAARRITGAAAGPFVTSAAVTATQERAQRLQARFGALCETMEGAAAARAAHAAGVAFAELRGVSNLVGPRDLSAWDIDGAVKAVGGALALFLREGGHG